MLRFGHMSRWGRVIAVALLAGGCMGRKAADNTPVPTPAPVAAATPTPGPQPVEAAQVAPTPPPSQPRPPRPGPGTPPGGPSGGCGTPTVSIDRPGGGQNITSSPQVVSANVGSNVVRVDFYYHVDVRPPLRAQRDPAVLIDVVTGPPFRTGWNVPRMCPATVSLLAIAYDSCGNVRDSGATIVTVCRP
jgi:hypothetical protein